MIETIITHRTTDGKEFHDKDRAQAHQGALDMSDRIHAFTAAKYPKNETAGKKAANIILEWEEWERLQDGKPSTFMTATEAIRQEGENICAGRP